MPNGRSFPLSGTDHNNGGNHSSDQGDDSGDYRGGNSETPIRALAVSKRATPLTLESWLSKRRNSAPGVEIPQARLVLGTGEGTFAVGQERDGGDAIVVAVDAGFAPDFPEAPYRTSRAPVALGPLFEFIIENISIVPL